MKNKKRLLKIVTIVLLFSAVVRFGNICLLTLGDYSKKNVYALSNTGAWVWWLMGDAADYEVDGDGAASVQFEGEYEISRESGGKWDALGMFGIHNVTDKEEGMLFYIRDYTCFRHIDENYISFIYINGKKNNYAEFHVEDGQIILSDDRYKEAMEEHAGSLDEIVQKAEEVLKSYKSVMNVFTIMAITFEKVLLAIHVLLITKIIALCRKITENIANEDQSSSLSKCYNLKWGLIEFLLYGFVIGLAVCFMKSRGERLYFELICIVYLLPPYILVMIVSFVIYFIRKRKLKSKDVQTHIKLL